MKKFDSNSIKYLIFLIITTAIIGIIIYPLFDLVYCSVFSKAKFVYSFYDHVIDPIIFAFAFGVAYWFVSKKKNKN